MPNLTHPGDSAPERFADLERQIADLAARLESYRLQACVIRILDDPWAGPCSCPACRRPALSLVTDEGVRLILEAAP